MKTLTEHNNEIDEKRRSIDFLLAAGVSCDKCGAEMRFIQMGNKNIDMGDVRCPSCGTRGYKKND